MQVVDKVPLACDRAFDVDGYAAVGVGNPAFLPVLTGKPNDKRTKAESLNVAFDIDF